MSQKFDNIKNELLSQVFAAADLIAYQSGAVVSRTLINQPEGTVTLFAFDKEQGLSEHTAPFDAMVYLLEGEAEIVIDKVPHNLKENDLIIMPAHIPHALKALAPFKMMLVMIKKVKPKADEI